MEARITIVLDDFRASAHEVVRVGPLNELSAMMLRTKSGIGLLHLTNHEGSIEILPFMGGMIWGACFFGVRLGMGSDLTEPKPTLSDPRAQGGLLHHAVSAAFCDLVTSGAKLERKDGAQIIAGEDAKGLFLTFVCWRYQNVDLTLHHSVTHTVTLRPGETEFDVTTAVKNLSERPLDLSYVAHANFAFVPGARILQPVPWTPPHVRLYTKLPRHVGPDTELSARLKNLAAKPGTLELLDPSLCDPELEFYLPALPADLDGWTHLALEQERGDGFALSYRPSDFPHLLRWLRHGPSGQAAGFALPSTHAPKDHAAEPSRRNARSIAPGETRQFSLRMGYLPPKMMAMRAREIAALYASR